MKVSVVNSYYVFFSLFFFSSFFFFFLLHMVTHPFTGTIHKIAVFLYVLRFSFAIFAVNVHDVLF